MDRQNLERRVLGGDREHLCVVGVWADTVEARANLELPQLQLGTQHWHLLLIGQLATPEGLRALADPQLTGPEGPVTSAAFGSSSRGNGSQRGR